MGQLQFTAKDPGDLLVCSEDGVQDEIRLDHLCRFEDRPMDRVVVEIGGTGLRVAAALLRRVEYGKVGGHAGLPAGYARNQAFAPAAETGKVMQADGAGDDHPVGLDDAPVDRHRQFGRCLAEGYKLFRVVAFMIADSDATIKRAKNFAMLCLRLFAVDAECDDDSDLLIWDTALIQLFNQDRQVDFTAGITGDVRGDDHNPFAWSNDLVQWSCADRIRQCSVNLFDGVRELRQG